MHADIHASTNSYVHTSASINEDTHAHTNTHTQVISSRTATLALAALVAWVMVVQALRCLA